MNESDLRQVLLLRAVETADVGQAAPAWTQADAAWASAAARREVGEQAAAPAFLVRRAQLGLRRLAGREPAWRHIVDRPTGHAGAWAALLLAVAYAVGMAGDVFTALHRVDLLPQTLLTLLLLGWNLVVYAALCVAALQRTQPGAASGAEHGPTRWFAAIAERLAAPHLRTLGGHARAVAAAVHGRFLVQWSVLARTLQQRRAVALMHAGAALLTLGVVSSMYLRGLVFDYRAGWDSTFLGAAEVHALLGAVLGPASAVSGIGLPDVPALARLRWAEGSTGESAARWIHLYALTLAGLVILPRLALAAWAQWRARRAARQIELPLNEAYFRQLLRALPAQAFPVTVLPYSYQLGAGQRTALEPALADVLGAGAQARIAATLPLGAEDELASHLPADLAEHVALLFAATATPEREMHGAFVKAAIDLRPAALVCVLVDEAGLRRQFGTGSDGVQRLRQRREAWQRMLQALSLPAPHFIDLGAANAAVRPEVSKGSAGG